MLALLDEQVPVEFADVLNAAAPERHAVRTVAEKGWRGTKNGELLRRVRDAGFGAVVTADRHIEHQQNIARSGVGLVVMHPPGFASRSWSHWLRRCLPHWMRCSRARCSCASVKQDARPPEPPTSR
ncbi:MAG TPA: hypothetical protein VF613_24200 [Longimicrobium sp.]